MRFMLIQWIEDPPTWDVLPTEKIMNGRCEIGGLCDVQYKEESSPAKILNVGTRSAMLKQLHSIEKNQSIKTSRPEGNEELGRGQRQKYSRILSESESSEEYESVSKQVSEKSVKRIRARSFLQQYNLEKHPFTAEDPLESSREATTSTRTSNDSGVNQHILAELKEIKSVLVETLTLLKNGCTPLMTGPVQTLPGPTSDLPAPESLPVPAPSSLLPLRVNETRSNNDCKKVRIGPNTSIGAEQFGHMKWTDAKKAAKDLLVAVFGRATLATHCYTGKSSNAFKDKEAKPQLEAQKVSDIIAYIKNKFNIEASIIKKAISQKCADECKMSKRRQNDCV